MKRTDFLKQAGTLALAPTLLPAFANRTTRKGLTKPIQLSEGDTVGLVAPAGIVFDEADYDRMERVLKDYGLNIKYGEHVRDRHGYFAGRDKDRAKDLNNMFGDPDIDGIVAVRGGWGCARILPYLDFEMIKNNPKIYCGFSDNTTLHFALMKYANLVTYHGPTGNSDWSDLTIDHFKKVLIDGDSARMESNSELKLIRQGRAEGPFMGGNLTILTTTLGTSYQPDTSGAILFLEDIGEPSYKIDRMLTHLKSAGLLDDINGFIFGQCTNCGDGTAPTFTLEEVLKQHIEPLGIPAVYNADIGHDEDNFTIPQGVKGELNADRKTIRLLEPGVTEREVIHDSF